MKFNIKPGQKLIECKHCNHWDDLRRLNDLCRNCNNSKLQLDPKDMLCNLCGETMCPPSDSWNSNHPYGLWRTTVSGGYDSPALLDGNTYTFSLCEKCLRKLFVQCKIKPDMSAYINSDYSWNWEKDQEYYEYKEWKENGGFHQAFLNGKCNVVKDCQNAAIYTQYNDPKYYTEYSACEEHQNINHGYEKLTQFICNDARIFL